MLYSPSTRVGFVHIPKTAGTSVSKVLADTIRDLAPHPDLPGPHHAVAELFTALAAAGDDPSTARVVTTICHPLVHAVSTYEYWRSGYVVRAERTSPHIRLARENDFEGFLEKAAWVDQFAGYLQVDGVIPENLTILRRESLGAGLNGFLHDTVGITGTVTVPVLNRVAHRPALAYLTPRVRELLLDSYHWTFGEGLYDVDEVPGDAIDAGGPGWSGRLRAARDRLRVLAARLRSTRG